MDPLRQYLYCVIPCGEERAFDVPAIGDSGGAVHTVCHEGLSVVVSDSNVARYETIRKNMIGHETVLERVMKEFTMLPIRFGTLTESSSIDDVKKLLRGRYREFKDLLSDMEGKCELSLKALWRDEQAVYAEILAEHPEIRKMRNSLANKSAGAIRYEGIDLGRKVKAALDVKRAQEAARLLHPLRRLAERIRENDVMVDRMILNVAFLVDKSRMPDFDLTVSKSDEESAGRLVLKYVGPVPPYNFVDIVVNWRELE